MWSDNTCVRLAIQYCVAGTRQPSARTHEYLLFKPREHVRELNVLQNEHGLTQKTTHTHTHHRQCEQQQQQKNTKKNHRTDKIAHTNMCARRLQLNIRCTETVLQIFRDFICIILPRACIC